MSPTLILALSLSLLACGDKEEEDTSSATDGGAADGGATDGGAEDGGSGDGGTEDGGATESDLTGVFTVSGGCSDTFIWATSEDQSWALWFRDDSDIVARAWAAGETQTDTYNLAKDYSLSPTVAVQRGSRLADAFCNDVPGEHEVEEEWYMTAGLVTISVTATGDKEPWGEIPAEATLTLQDAVFTTHGGEPVTLSTYETTVAVGWLPG